MARESHSRTFGAASAEGPSATAAPDDFEPMPSGAGPSGPSPYIKNCRRCGEPLFEDMDVCFECLYDYTNPSLDYAGSGALDDPLGWAPLDEPMPLDAYQSDFTVPDTAPSGCPVPDSRGLVTTDPPRQLRSYLMATSDDGSDESPSDLAGTSDGFPVESGNRSDPGGGSSGEGGSTPEEMGEDAIREDAAMARERRQDEGLFPEPVPAGGSGARGRDIRQDAVQLGVLVRYRGLEMTEALRDGRITIGRDRACDIKFSDFDIPSVAATIEWNDVGVELDLPAEGVEARLDGAPIDRKAGLGPGQEVELFGARLSLVRLD